MCALAHRIEEGGISTTLIGLIPQHVERMRPPRALIVPFELGRPLGEPGNPAMQHRVLDAALGLVSRMDSPSIEYFDDPTAAPVAPPASAWACPVSFSPPADSEDSLLSGILAEITLLEPWHDRAVMMRGSSAVGASGMDVRTAARYLAAFLLTPWPQPVSGLTTADCFKLAAEDLKLYYLESAAAQPDGSSRLIGDWFWDQSMAGALLRQLADQLKETADPLLNAFVRFTLVPENRSRSH